MITQIKRWLAPPVFPDDETKTRRALLLDSVLLTAVLLVLCIIAGNLAGGTVPATVTGGDIVFIAACLALRRWVHQGQIGLAGGALLTGGLVSITLSVAMLGTVRAPATSTFMLLVILAGLVFDLGGMIVMTVLCSLAIAGLIVAENSGWLPRPDYTETITQWVTFTVLCAWVGSLTLAALQSTHRALTRANQEIAERKWAEAALRESEEFKAAIFNSVVSHIAVPDHDGVIVAVNTPWQRFTLENPMGTGEPARNCGVGVNYLEVCRRSVGESAEGALDVHDGIQSVLEGRKETFAFEYPCHSPQQQRWFTLMVTALGTGARGVVISHIDITGRKRAEEALRESEEKYRQLVNASSDPIFSFDPHGNYLFVNNAFAKPFGKMPEEIIGTSPYALFPKHEAEKRLNTVREVFQTGEKSEIEVQVITHTGEITYYLTIADPIKNREGKVICVSCSSRNITKRKRAEDALRESEERFRVLVNTSPDGITVIDLGGHLTFVSDHALEIFGLDDPQEALGHSPLEFVAPEDQSRTSADILNGFRGIHSLQNQYTMLKKNGTSITAEIKSALITDATGVPNGMVAVIRDITDRKQVEEAMHESEERLKQAQRIGHLGYLDWNLTTHEMILSEEALEICHLDQDKNKFVLEEVVTLVHPDDKERVEKSLESAVAGIAKHDLEHRIVCPDGHEVHVRATAELFRDLGGKPVRLLGTILDITERKHAEEKLYRAQELLTVTNHELERALAREQLLARTDALTGVNNRRCLFELAEHEFGVAARYQHALSVILFDIDHFKQVNDTFGHAVGDLVLEQVARVARAQLRDADIIARYGGEEFVVILPMTMASQAHPVAERIRAGVAAIHVPTPQGDVTVTLSLGVAEITALDDSVELVIKRADEAMYAAKQAGRNRVVVVAG